jgi:hypothetical protein
MTEERSFVYNGRENCNDPGTKESRGLVRLYTKSERDKSRCCGGHDAKLKSGHVAWGSTPSKTLSGTRGYWRGACTDDVFFTWRSLAYGVEICMRFVKLSQCFAWMTENSMGDSMVCWWR